MSKHNKVNRDHYTQRGRLTPDEAARERAKQREASSPQRTEGKTPPFQTTKPRPLPEDSPSPVDEDSAAVEKHDQPERHDENTGADKRLD